MRHRDLLTRDPPPPFSHASPCPLAVFIGLTLFGVWSGSEVLIWSERAKQRGSLLLPPEINLLPGGSEKLRQLKKWLKSHHWPGGGLGGGAKGKIVTTVDRQGLRS